MDPLGGNTHCWAVAFKSQKKMENNNKIKENEDGNKKQLYEKDRRYQHLYNSSLKDDVMVEK